MKKAGGNRLLTKIKHVEGDIEALKKDISAALGMEGHKEVVVNELTKSVVLKVCLHGFTSVILDLERNLEDGD